MLEQEYQPRRKPPRAALKPGTLPTQFTFTLGEATLEDMPAVLALYRHYVRNSVVTFDETPPTLAVFRSRFLHRQKLGYPFRLALSPSGTLLGLPMCFLFEKKLLFAKRSRVLFIWARPRWDAAWVQRSWRTSLRDAKRRVSRKLLPSSLIKAPRHLSHCTPNLVSPSPDEWAKWGSSLSGGSASS